MACPPCKAPPKAFGKLPTGALALASRQPIPLQVAGRIDDCLTLGGELSSALPLPDGMELFLNPNNRQVQLIFRARVFALRLRKAYGYVVFGNFLFGIFVAIWKGDSIG